MTTITFSLIFVMLKAEARFKKLCAFADALTPTVAWEPQLLLQPAASIPLIIGAANEVPAHQAQPVLFLIGAVGVALFGKSWMKTPRMPLFTPDSPPRVIYPSLGGWSHIFE